MTIQDLDKLVHEKFVGRMEFEYDEGEKEFVNDHGDYTDEYNYEIIKLETARQIVLDEEIDKERARLKAYQEASATLLRNKKLLKNESMLLVMQGYEKCSMVLLHNLQKLKEEICHASLQ